MGLTKYGDKQGRVLKEKLAGKVEWTEEDQVELEEEQADVLDDDRDDN